MKLGIELSPAHAVQLCREAERLGQQQIPISSRFQIAEASAISSGMTIGIPARPVAPTPVLRYVAPRSELHVCKANDRMAASLQGVS